jgi:hypothetical protein
MSSEVDGSSGLLPHDTPVNEALAAHGAMDVSDETLPDMPVSHKLNVDCPRQNGEPEGVMVMLAVRVTGGVRVGVGTPVCEYEREMVAGGVGATVRVRLKLRLRDDVAVDVNDAGAPGDSVRVALRLMVGVTDGDHDDEGDEEELCDADGDGVPLGDR